MMEIFHGRSENSHAAVEGVMCMLREGWYVNERGPDDAGSGKVVVGVEELEALFKWSSVDKVWQRIM